MTRERYIRMTETTRRAVSRLPGGTQYGKLKAGGVSTRKFEYTLIQDEALRETTLSVQVEGETYLLEENTESPMYRYDVLVGTKDMMQNPYESYKPSKEAV